MLRRSVCGLCGCTGMAADVLAKGVLLAPVLSAWGEKCFICTLCGRHCMPVEQHYEVVQESVLTGSPVQGPSYAALIAHRVWSRHPTRHRWAGFILAGAAVWWGSPCICILPMWCPAIRSRSSARPALCSTACVQMTATASHKATDVHLPAALADIQNAESSLDSHSVRCLQRKAKHQA